MRMRIMSVYTSHAFRRAEKSRERLFGAPNFTCARKRSNGNGSTQLHASDFSARGLARRNAHMESRPYIPQAACFALYYYMYASVLTSSPNFSFYGGGGKEYLNV